jgi:hypothetical protein
VSFSEIMAAIGRRTGLPLQFGATDSCALAYDIGLEMLIASVDHGQSVLLYQPLHRVTSAHKAELLQRCMELNVYGAETNGLALGLDPETSWIVLSQRMPFVGTDPDRLATSIAVFMATAIALIGKLGDDIAAPARGADASLPGDAIRA